MQEENALADLDDANLRRHKKKKRQHHERAYRGETPEKKQASPQKVYTMSAEVKSRLGQSSQEAYERMIKNLNLTK